MPEQKKDSPPEQLNNQFAFDVTRQSDLNALFSEGNDLPQTVTSEGLSSRDHDPPGSPHPSKSKGLM